MSGKVYLQSLRGQDLVPQDGKSCDPYVVVKINGVELKTERAPKSHAAPVFQELNDMCFQWDGQSALPEVEFTVFDHDYIGSDDFIGYARVQLYVTTLNKENRVALHIRNEKDAGILKDYGSLGALYYSFAVDDPALVGQQQEPPVAPVPAMKKSVPPQAAPQQAPPAAAPVPAVELQQQQAPPPQQQPLRPVKFTCIQAENLAPADGSTADPYMKVIINGTEYDLPKQSKTCSPKWEEVAHITIPWDGKNAMPVVEFIVKDANMLLSDEFLGCAKLPLNPAMINDKIKVNLKPGEQGGDKLLQKYGTLGSVYVTLDGPELPGQQRKMTAVPAALPVTQARSATPPAQPAPAAPLESFQGGIAVKVSRAANLLNRDVVGNASDPFAIVFTQNLRGEMNEIGRTQVINRTINPVWDRTFNITGTSYASIQFALLDQDPHGPGDFLGMAVLQLENLPTRGKQTLTLSGRPDQPGDSTLIRKLGRSDYGMLDIEWVIDRNAGTPTDPEPPQMRQMKSAPPQRQQQQQPAQPAGEEQYGDQLNVTVLTLTNLRGKCDPYVSVEVEGQSQSNEGDAGDDVEMIVWNWTGSFTVGETQSSIPIYLEVTDKTTRKVIGGAHIVVSRDALERQNTVTTSIYPVANKRPLSQSAPVGELTVVTRLKAGPRNTNIKNDAVLRLCVVSAHGVTSPDPRPPNPYLIVQITGDEEELEYRSATVENNKNPQWYFHIPPMDITSPNHKVVVSLWDEDPMGFDDFIGQTTLDISSFTRGFSAVELQLEDRGDATGESNFTDFGRIILEWSVQKRAKVAMFNAPKILEVTVLEGEHLAASESANAVVHVSCDDQPNAQLLTAVVPKANAVWNEGIQLRVDGNHNQLRLTLWDDTSRAANFLGEYVVNLATMDLEKTEVMKVNLRPRKEPPHLNAQDVALLNQNMKGLGTLTFSLRLFSIRDYETRTRDRLRETGQAYSFVMQVADTADVPRRAKYFIKASAGGEDRVSQIESGFHPKFRKRFHFDLHYETEMATVSLMERLDDGTDISVGEVTFPVSPPDRVGSEPITAWVNLKSTTHDSIPTKLLIRWRTFRDNANNSATNESIGGGTPTRPLSTSNNNNVASVEPSMILADENVPRGRKASPSPNRKAVRATSPARSQQEQPTPSSNGYSLNVYSPDYSSIVKFSGFPGATASDAIAQSIREFGVKTPMTFAIVFNGLTLPSTAVLQEQVPSGETVFLMSTNSGLPQQAQQSMVGSYMPQNATPIVLDRLRTYGADSAVVTAAAVLNAPMNSQFTQRACEICQMHRVNGFGRPVANGSSEVILQGAPRLLSMVLQEIVSAIPSAIVEEVKGYIPMLATGFRVTYNETDAANMFEICSTPYGTEQGADSGQCWFYKATDELNLPGVRYIDERA